MKKEKVIIRLCDINGNRLYKKYNFLYNFKNKNTLLFIINDNYIIYSLNNNIIYNLYINSIYKTDISYLEFNEFKSILINKDYKKLLDSFLKSHDILISFEYNLLNDINDWLNNYNICSKKIYKLMQS